MASDHLVTSARAVWTRLAGVPVEFPAAGGVTVVHSPASLLCPSGWAGIVVIGGAGIATAPDEQQAERLRRAVGRLTTAPLTGSEPSTTARGSASTVDGDPVAGATDPGRVRAVLAVAEELGPATLAYLDAADVRPVGGHADAVPPGHRDVAALLASVPDDEAGESGLDEVESDVFVVRRDGRVAAAAGYHRWATVAHLCVLTAPDARGQGLARAVAAAAVQDALAAGLLPQWRARPESSRRVARALGFRELGTQLSIRLGEAGPHTEA